MAKRTPQLVQVTLRFGRDRLKPGLFKVRPRPPAEPPRAGDPGGSRRRKLKRWFFICSWDRRRSAVGNLGTLYVV